VGDETLKEFILGVTFGKADETNLDAATGTAEQAARKVETSWKGVGKVVAAGIATIGTAVVGAAAGLFALADKSTKTADAIAKASRNAGIAADEFQRLAHAGNLSDVSTQTLGRTVQTLNRQILEAQRGGVTPFSESLATVGLELDDLRGSATENLGTLFDALNRIPDEGDRAALAVELLGKGGREMGSLIAGGSAELRAMGDEAQRLGLIIDEEALAASEEFQDSLTRMEGALGSIARDIGISVAPAIDDVVTQTTEWAAANREVIATDLESSARGLGDAIVSLLPLLAQMVGLIGDAASEWALLAEAANLTPEQVAAETGRTVDSSGWAAAKGAVGGPIKAFGTLVSGGDVEASDFVGGPIGAALGLFGGDEGRGEAAEIIRNRRRIQGDAARSKRKREADRERLNLAPFDVQGPTVGEGGLKYNPRTGKYEREKKRGGGGKRKGATPDFEAEDFELLEAEDMFGADLDRLAARVGATPEQRQAALEAASSSLAGNASPSVALKAATSRLSSLTGVDVSPSKDPMMSEIFGENVPDIELSKLAMGAQPQTLIATINNTFNTEIANEINGAGNPADVASQVVQTFKTVIEGTIAKSTKTAGVPWAR
jgi:hypothetical protein